MTKAGDSDGGGGGDDEDEEDIWESAEPAAAPPPAMPPAMPPAKAASRLAGAGAHLGRVRVTLQTEGFCKIWHKTGEIFEEARAPPTCPSRYHPPHACHTSQPDPTPKPNPHPSSNS